MARILFEDVLTKTTKVSDRKIMRAAAKELFPIYKARIFEQGANSDGGPIGNYTSQPYINKRINKGLQVSFVDLEFTSSMKNNLQVSKSGVVAFGFTNEKMAERADYNEKRYGPIFELTSEEEEMYLEILTKLLFP